MDIGRKVNLTKHVIYHKLTSKVWAKKWNEIIVITLVKCHGTHSSENNHNYDNDENDNDDDNANVYLCRFVCVNFLLHPVICR